MDKGHLNGSGVPLLLGVKIGIDDGGHRPGERPPGLVEDDTVAFQAHDPFVFQGREARQLQLEMVGREAVARRYEFEVDGEFAHIALDHVAPLQVIVGQAPGALDGEGARFDATPIFSDLRCVRM
jgi:hypothetical protein